MALNIVTKSLDLGDGRTITIETGKLAKQADGSVVLREGDTMLLATVVSNASTGAGVDFMPLTVDYKEKYASVGKFPGGFFKREARPSEYEILICRLVDRALRPLFPDDYHSDTQVMIQLMSGDKNTLPDAYACLAASAALAVSDIPFNGPISETRIGRVNGELKVNPSISDLEESDLDIMVAGTLDSIVMIEGEMKEVSEADMLVAVKKAHEVIKQQCQMQLDLASEVEKSKVKREYSHEVHDEDLRKKVHADLYDKAYAVAGSETANKKMRGQSFSAIRDEYMETFSEEELAAKADLIKVYYKEVMKEASRNVTLDERKRLDGRKLNEIRPIWSEVSYLPAAHGSAVFTRGETQSITSVTLGTKLDEQMIDGAIIDGYNKFLLHYNFPSFSVGEARPNRGTSRREIGHGNLAMRAIKPVLPTGEENPYTVRIVSDILESNGSSSMATVCAGILALMDAGVKVKKPVSGIAMGLISTPDMSKYAVLSDILGDEDHLGDMDFKVTGTEDGITACQMDIKINGLSYDLLEEAMAQAREGRLHILGEMKKTMSAPREDYKPFVPRIEQVIIPKDFIGAIIGPGGKVIQEMQKLTNTTITIEEVGDEGHIQIASADKEGIEAAKARIKGITAIPDVGEVYDAVVKSIMPYGAFVEFLPGKQGLLHVSEISWDRIDRVEDVLKDGQDIKVKLLEVDQRSGKFKLSHKVLTDKPEGYVERSGGGDRDRRGGGDRGGRGGDRNGGGDRRPPREDRNN